MRLTICKDYNGRKDVLFMMRDDDTREGYETATRGKYARGVLTTNDGLTYKVHADWSVSAIETDAFKCYVVNAVRLSPAKRNAAQRAALIAARALA